MDYNAVLQAISTLGFPIVMCGALFWKLLRQDSLHREEVAQLTIALENNTLAMQKIADKLGGMAV